MPEQDQANRTLDRGQHLTEGRQGDPMHGKALPVLLCTAHSIRVWIASWTFSLSLYFEHTQGNHLLERQCPTLKPQTATLIHAVYV